MQRDMGWGVNMNNFVLFCFLKEKGRFNYRSGLNKKFMCGFLRDALLIRTYFAFAIQKYNNSASFPGEKEITKVFAYEMETVITL